MIRLHVPSPLTADAAILPTLDQSRYLTQVMRLKAGDDLLVFNGRDGEWRATIAEVLKKGVVLRAEDQVRPQTFGPDLDLIVAVVKKSRVETIVEKAAGGIGGGIGGSDCTPGYYNNEGRELDGPPWAAPYGGGSIAFFEMMQAWRDAGDLGGLDLA
jgi:hypothetical protein